VQIFVVGIYTLSVVLLVDYLAYGNINYTRVGVKPQSHLLRAVFALLLMGLFNAILVGFGVAKFFGIYEDYLVTFSMFCALMQALGGIWDFVSSKIKPGSENSRR